MAQPKVLVLRAAGVNCDRETVYAWQLAGARADCLHINRLRETPALLDDYAVLTVPGGFSYGDDISAGKIFANQLGLFLGDAIQGFVARGRLVLGICNGFQVLCKAGLLPGREGGADLPAVTVTYNVSGKYEDRWVRLKKTAGHCVFLPDEPEFELPVAHGEGRVLAASSQEMDRLESAGCVALKYVSRDGDTIGYPDNPNGSMHDVAALCDPTGRILGLMPHPERFIHPTQHPQWTRRKITPPAGRRLFEAAVKCLS